MKTILKIIFCLLLVVRIFCQTNPNIVWVKGYYRSNGTYVEGHYRTAPNHTNVDNFSTKGNKNPYTGKLGWITPDRQKNPWAKENEIIQEKEPSKDNNIYSRNSDNHTSSENTTFTNTKIKEIWYSKEDQVNVRIEPNKTAKIAFRINKGDEFVVLSKSENTQLINGYGQDFWYEIKFNNLTGWVFGKLIGSYNNSTSIINEWNGKFLTITMNSVNVRTDPTTKTGEVKFQLNRGNQVEIIAKTINMHFVNGYGEDYWYYIKFEDKVGWVFGKLTE